MKIYFLSAGRILCTEKKMFGFKQLYLKPEIAK